MSLLKPAGIQSLNTGHSLYGNLAAFWEIGQTDKDLVSDTALGTTRTVANDADIGACRTYTDTAPGDFSQTLPVTKGASYTFIFKSLQEYGPSSTLMDGTSLYNQMELRIDRYSSGSVRLDQRYGSGSTVINEWHPFSTDALMDDPQIMTLTVDASGNTALYVNGSVVAPKAGTDLPNTDAPDASPMAHDILPVLESANNFYLGAVIKHDKVLTSGEITTFHADPWAAVSTGASVTVTPGDLPLVPGGAISGSYTDFATVPTTLTVSDGTNTITIASPTISDNGDGTGTFSGTMPSLPTSGTANLILFGNVTVELS